MSKTKIYVDTRLVNCYLLYTNSVSPAMLDDTDMKLKIKTDCTVLV